jgi:hypothetical protein
VTYYTFRLLEKHAIELIDKVDVVAQANWNRGKVTNLKQPTTSWTKDYLEQVKWLTYERDGMGYVCEVHHILVIFRVAFLREVFRYFFIFCDFLPAIRLYPLKYDKINEVDK